MEIICGYGSGVGIIGEEHWRVWLEHTRRRIGARMAHSLPEVSERSSSYHYREKGPGKWVSGQDRSTQIRLKEILLNARGSKELERANDGSNYSAEHPGNVRAERTDAAHAEA